MIYGMTGLTGPATAVRGNKIAAAGMAIAVIATLVAARVSSMARAVWLILLGVAIGTRSGSRRRCG